MHVYIDPGTATAIVAIIGAVGGQIVIIIKLFQADKVRAAQGVAIEEVKHQTNSMNAAITARANAAIDNQATAAELAARPPLPPTAPS
jgi:hypothetical protein